MIGTLFARHQRLKALVVSTWSKTHQQSVPHLTWIPITWFPTTWWYFFVRKISHNVNKSRYESLSDKFHIMWDLITLWKSVRTKTSLPITKIVIFDNEYIYYSPLKKELLISRKKYNIIRKTYFEWICILFVDKF